MDPNLKFYYLMDPVIIEFGYLQLKMLNVYLIFILKIRSISSPAGLLFVLLF